MLAGHFGIAQLAKGARRDLPLLLLVTSAYLPDLVRVAIAGLTPRFDVFSHSLPIVGALSLAVAILWLLRGGQIAAAGVLALACLLHWPADVFTGCKPTTFDGPWIGLVSYRRPVSDLVVEGLLVVGGWLYMRRRGFGIGSLWLIIPLLVQIAFLVSMYWGAEFFIGRHEWTWRPNETWRPQPHVLETLSCRAPDIASSFH